MSIKERDNEYEQRIRASEERLRLGEAASGIATFEFTFDRKAWDWSAQAATIFGLDGQNLAHWEKQVFVDDLPKIHAAVEAAKQGANFHVEFRVKRGDGSLHWVAGKGQNASDPPGRILRGAIYEITERKVLDARLLALNETLEARVAELRQEAGTLEVLNRTGVAIAAERDLAKLVQIVTDAGVQLSRGAVRRLLLQRAEGRR